MAEIEVTIEKLAFGGDGIAHVDGKVCFVGGVAPGEKVLVRVVKEKKDYTKAEPVKILTPSPARVEPPCPYVNHPSTQTPPMGGVFAQDSAHRVVKEVIAGMPAGLHCGGCQYQHLAYSEELRWKEEQVRESLIRSLGITADLIRPVQPSGHEYRYRNSVSLHRTAAADGIPQRLGFIAQDNESVIPVDDCLLAEEGLAPVLKGKISLKGGMKGVSFKLSEDGRIFSDLRHELFKVRIGEETLWAHSGGFFQTNLGITGKISQKISEWIKRFQPESFFYLYAGVGTFAFLSAGGVKKIYCVEEDKLSVSAMKANQQYRKTDSMRIFTGKAEKLFPELLEKETDGKIFVMMDPPRQGIVPQLADFLSGQDKIGAITYLSCDLPTLARDLKKILSGGKYRLTEVVPFDMFPRTKHIEIAALLSRA